MNIYTVHEHVHREMIDIHVITNVYKTKHRERERGRRGGGEEGREGGTKNERKRWKERERANVYAVINIHTQMMVLTCA